MIESGEGKLMGTNDIKNIVLPGIIRWGTKKYEKTT